MGGKGDIIIVSGIVAMRLSGKSKDSFFSKDYNGCEISRRPLKGAAAKEKRHDGEETA